MYAEMEVGGVMNAGDEVLLVMKVTEAMLVMEV